jgi:hypothetical protein
LEDGLLTSGRPSVQRQADKKVVLIEDALADGLASYYLSMGKEKRQLFKREGERVAREISRLLGETKINVKKIIQMIKQWLSMIPGVSSFFVEQEAKIKADEILKVTRNNGV